MTIEVVTANDEVVSVRLVRGKPVADIDALRKYHREYYHANKQECECEHCTVKFSSQSALVRHQHRSQKCALLRAKAELEMLRSGQVVKISETTSAAAAAALEEESKCDRCGSQDGVIGGGANDYFINLCKCCFDKDAAGSKISKAVG